MVRGSGGAHAAPPRKWRLGGARSLVSIALVLGLLVGVTAYRLTHTAGSPTAGTNPSAGACGGDPLTVVVTPALESVARDALAAATAATPCQRYAVSAQSDDTVLANIGAGQAPEAWLTDSSTWLDLLPADSRTTYASAGSVASSPVVLAAPLQGAATAPGSWAGIFTDKGLFRVTNPAVDAASRTAYYAARVGQAPTLDAASASHLVLTSRFAAATVGDLFATAADTATKGGFPVSEQTLAAWTRDHPGVLRPLMPTAGSATLDVPLLARSDLAASRKQLVSAAFSALTTPKAREAMASAGFRAPDRSGGPTIEGIVAPEYTDLALGTITERTAALEQWEVLRTDMRMLAVLDVSGSMKERAPGTTLPRWQVMEQACTNALQVLPDGAQIGAWLFSTLKGGPSQDWLELSPVERLDAVSAGRTHRQVLLDALPTIEGQLSGDTALYDTTLAAFTTMTSSYNAGFINSVVVMTDGRNDNPRGGLSLDQLLSELDSAKDPSRPVRIITIGMGEADPSALQQISAATGGTSYIANTPQDIERILVEALLARRVAPA